MCTMRCAFWDSCLFNTFAANSDFTPFRYILSGLLGYLTQSEGGARTLNQSRVPGSHAEMSELMN